MIKDIKIEDIKTNEEVLNMIEMALETVVDIDVKSDAYIVSLYEMIANRYLTVTKIERDLYFIGGVLLSMFDFQQESFQALLDHKGLVNVHFRLLEAIKKNPTLNFMYESVEENAKEKNSTGMMIKRVADEIMLKISEVAADFTPEKLEPMLEELGRISKEANEASKEFGLDINKNK